MSNLLYFMKVDAAIWLPWSLWAVEGMARGKRSSGPRSPARHIPFAAGRVSSDRGVLDRRDPGLCLHPVLRRTRPGRCSRPDPRRASSTPARPRNGRRRLATAPHGRGQSTIGAPGKLRRSARAPDAAGRHPGGPRGARPRRSARRSAAGARHTGRLVADTSGGLGKGDERQRARVEHLRRAWARAARARGSGRNTAPSDSSGGGTRHRLRLRAGLARRDPSLPTTRARCRRSEPDPGRYVVPVAVGSRPRRRGPGDRWNLALACAHDPGVCGGRGRRGSPLRDVAPRSRSLRIRAPGIAARALRLPRRATLAGRRRGGRSYRGGDDRGRALGAFGPGGRHRRGGLAARGVGHAAGSHAAPCGPAPWRSPARRRGVPRARTPQFP